MDIQPQTTQPISDDQELAKVLAGVSKEAEENLGFEETPVPTAHPAEDPIADSMPPREDSQIIGTPDPTPVVEAGNNLDSIKKDALVELRPLVDKLTLAPEEKFDIYLLLLRSSDDKSLIAPAHAAAKEIPDETRRAQALLDVIKEIDYLSSPIQQ